MFSATKFVVAGAIVALFGGFLLAGVLTTQQDEEAVPAVGASASASPDAVPTPDAATTYAAVRSQLVTEELLPGVSRVIRDGAGYEFATGQPHRVSIAPDGAVWVMGTNAIVELGKPGSYQLGSPDLDFESIDEVEFGPDGTNWALSSSGLWSWPEGEFVAPAWAGWPLRALEALPDGTVWAAGGGGLARLDEDGWSAFPAADVPLDRPGGVALGDTAYLAATTDGHLWTVTATSDPDTHAIRRYDGASWESMQPLGPGRSFLVDALAAGSDGRVWAALRGCNEADCSWSGDEPLLASFDGSDWKVLSAEDGVRFVGAPQMWGGIMGVSGNGIVMATQDQDVESTAISLAMFDSNGSLATLGGLDGLLGSDIVDTIAPAPDGSFWVSIWDNNVGGVIIIEPDELLADSTTTTSDLVPGVDLVTEEVEPGVYRVLSDGVDDLSDIPDLEVPATMASGGECWAFLVGGECWANAYGMLVREVDGELPIEQVPDAEHGLTFPAQEVIGPLPGSGDTGWLIITGPTGFQGLLGYGPQGWTRVPYAAGEDGRVLSIDPGSACGVVLGPDRYPGLVGPDGTAWVYTLEREGLRVTGWDGDSWSSFGPVDIGTPDVEDPCLLLDAAFGPNGTMWFTTRRIPLYVITPEAVAGTE